MSLEKRDGNTIIKKPTNGIYRGPFGLWVWPVVNIIIALVDKLRGRGGGVAREARTKITELRPTAEGGWSILEHEV